MSKSHHESVTTHRQSVFAVLASGSATFAVIVTLMASSAQPVGTPLPGDDHGAPGSLDVLSQMANG